MEKAKGAKIFHTRTLSDRPEPALAGVGTELGISREQPECFHVNINREEERS